MAWGLAEFDAEQRGYKEGVSDGISQAKIETAKNLLTMGITIEQVAQGTGLSLETIENIAQMITT